MTNKKEKRNLVLVFFKMNQVPEDLKKYAKEVEELNISEKNFFRSGNKVFVFLNNLEKLNKLQKNYFLIYAGLKLAYFCGKGIYKIDFFGDSSLYQKNIYLGWHLSSYRFSKFKHKSEKIEKGLLEGKSKNEIESLASVYFFVRDLINMPANILGPSEIYKSAIKFLSNNFSYRSVEGQKLKKGFPLISAVGQGASNSKKPMFCEFISKSKRSKRKIFIVGKGVSFDTGGLNLKGGVGMSLMKKDMGGAANAIGLARLLSKKKMNLEIHLLLCLVENSVSENSIRPSDILESRKGLYVEVGDTDAEGRLIMADALSYASEFNPELIIDMATLTGASRVAMGIDIPSFFSNDDDLSMSLIHSSQEVGDPVWQLPLWQNYSNQLSSIHADIKNIGTGAFGGAITAALFLEKFVGEKIPWIHLDMMAWSKTNKLNNYEGGDAMGIRALENLIEKRFV